MKAVYLVLGLLLLGGLALVPILSEQRSAPGVDDIRDLSRVERIAGELEDSPLYVHHDPWSRWWHDEGITELAERLAEPPLSDLPVYVVVHPSTAADETGGNPRLFLRALHEVSGRDGIYLSVVNDGWITAAAFNAPVALPDRDSYRRVTDPVWQVEFLLGALENAPRTETPRDEVRGEEVWFTGGALPEGASSGSAPGFWPMTAAGAVAGLVAVARTAGRTTDRSEPRGADRWARPWSRLPRVLLRLPSDTPAAYRSRWAPNRAGRWWLRPLLRRELRRLHARLEAAPADHPRRVEAVGFYDVAGLIAQSPHLPVQALVFAVVAARTGTQLIEHPDLPLRGACQVNPLHGTANHRDRFGDSYQRLLWHVCDRCHVRGQEPDRFNAMLVRDPQGVLGHYRSGRDFWADQISRPVNAPDRLLRHLEV